MTWGNGTVLTSLKYRDGSGNEKRALVEMKFNKKAPHDWKITTSNFDSLFPKKGGFYFGPPGKTFNESNRSTPESRNCCNFTGKSGASGDQNPVFHLIEMRADRCEFGVNGKGYFCDAKQVDTPEMDQRPINWFIPK